MKHFLGSSGENVSGILWHVAFGSVGDKVFKHCEDVRENYEGDLGKGGILMDHDYILGLIFHVEYNFYTFNVNHELTYDDGLNKFLEYVAKRNCHYPMFLE